MALEEEVVEVLDGLLARAVPRAVERLVEVLRGAVVARVLRVAKAVREAVQRARRRHRLVRLPSVDYVEQVRLHPARKHIAVSLKPGEPLRVLHELLNEALDGQLHLAAQTARVAVVREPREERGQHAVHLEVLEVEITNLREPELSIALGQGHQAAPSWARVISSRPSAWRATR